MPPANCAQSRGLLEAGPQLRPRFCCTAALKMGYPQCNGTPHGEVHLEHGTACTGQQALVAGSRAEHLPAAASARAAHPYST